MTKITFLGLGVMGYPMAGHLARAGHEVTVYNRTAAKAGAWASEHGGATGATPAEASKGAEMVMACVGNDNDLRSICLGTRRRLCVYGRGQHFRRSHHGLCRGHA
jgi:3-hydroxyisobutyrate dehydrogenase